ncbi:hypothetical protein KY289_013318 [Solanum tuberosum]|nr:hypothetical protein KY289_013318 [Solanum tuberosum]
MRQEFENFQGEIGLYRANIDEHMAETLNFREAATLQVDRLQKENEVLRAEIIVLRWAVAASGSTWELLRVPETDKLNIITMSLIGDAKLWWRTRNADDESVGRPRIDNWSKLKKKISDQFLPSNASWLARDNLKRLRQNDSMWDYIKEYLCDNVKDLLGPIAAADSLVDFRSTRLIVDVPSTLKPKTKGEKKGDWKRENRKDNACPNRERVNTFLAGKLNQGKEEEEVVATMMNLLGLSFYQITLVNNVEGASNASNPHASLIHIEMNVKDQRVMAMADTRATHMFVDVKIAAKLGLKLTKSPSYVKTVDSKAQAIVGMAYGVPMSIGNWVGKHNLMVMSLSEFEIILGINFLRKF